MGVSSALELTKVNITLKGHYDMARFKHEDVMRIVEAIISGGGYDLEPEETVDVAFNIVEKITRRLIEENSRYL